MAHCEYTVLYNVYFDDKLWLLSIIWHNVETVRVAERRTESIQLPPQRACFTEAVRNYCLCLPQPVICLICSKTDQVSYGIKHFIVQLMHTNYKSLDY